MGLPVLEGTRQPWGGQTCTRFPLNLLFPRGRVLDQGSTFTLEEQNHNTEPMNAKESLSQRASDNLTQAKIFDPSFTPRKNTPASFPNPGPMIRGHQMALPDLDGLAASYTAD